MRYALSRIALVLAAAGMTSASAGEEQCATGCVTLTNIVLAEVIKQAQAFGRAQASKDCGRPA